MWGFHLDLVIMSHWSFLIPINGLQLTFKLSSKMPLKYVDHQLEDLEAITTCSSQEVNYKL